MNRPRIDLAGKAADLSGRGAARLLRFISLGAMAEKWLTSKEEVYLKRQEGQESVSLRIDVEWTLTPREARVLSEVLGLEER